MPNPARTGHQEVDGVTIFVTRGEEPYSWCALYELGGSMRGGSWSPRKFNTCNRTYPKLIARVREDIRQHRALLGAYSNPVEKGRDCGGWDPNSDDGWDQCDPKTIPRERHRVVHAKRVKNITQVPPLPNPLPSYVKGLGVIVAGVTTGAVLGAATAPPCDGTFQILCGPRIGAELGGIAGLGLTALGAAGTAVVTKNETAKNAAIVGGVTFAVLWLAGTLINKFTPAPVATPAPVPTPAPVAA